MKSVRFLVKVIGIRWQYEDFITYENLIDNSRKYPPNILVNKNDVMRIQYTSGTTGVIQKELHIVGNNTNIG